MDWFTVLVGLAAIYGLVVLGQYIIGVIGMIRNDAAKRRRMKYRSDKRTEEWVEKHRSKP